VHPLSAYNTKPKLLKNYGTTTLPALFTQRLGLPSLIGGSLRQLIGSSRGAEERASGPLEPGASRGGSLHLYRSDR
jgi:hypothetical protein